jgi:hypothetical protein
MRSTALSLAALPVIALLCGCDPTTIKYSTTYSLGANQSRFDCVIVLADGIDVDYQGNVEEEFGPGDARVLIGSFFDRQLPVVMQQKTRFKPVRMEAQMPRFSSRQIPLEVSGKGEMRLTAPTDGSIVTFGDQTPAFVLFLSSVDIVSKLEVSSTPGMYMAGPPGSGGHMTGGTMNSEKNLVVKGRFVLWDNAGGQLIAHGYIEAVDENRFAVSMEDWNNVMATFVERMLCGTSFCGRID